ncbi:MAG TPA: Crp/Fnr family transcriptional regulator [Cytophagaceae bacterium]|jgi:CRP-like cAMP-binding protein|nr:Crp/Fnr family transcriptional regulator [Cytophagaceae bacterium]
MTDSNFSEGTTFKSVVKEVKKGEVLLRTGDLCDSFFKVIKGCLRSYIIDPKGKEHIVQFAPEEWLIGDQESMFNHVLATLNIDAIEDSTIAVIKFSQNENKLSDLDKASLIDLNQKFQKRIFVLQKRIIQLISATAEERYNEFNSTYPNLVKRVPQKMIASYLGITPESLSRVRKEIITKK